MTTDHQPVPGDRVRVRDASLSLGRLDGRAAILLEHRPGTDLGYDYKVRITELLCDDDRGSLVVTDGAYETWVSDVDWIPPTTSTERELDETRRWLYAAGQFRMGL